MENIQIISQYRYAKLMRVEAPAVNYRVRKKLAMPGVVKVVKRAGRVHIYYDAGAVQTFTGKPFRVNE